jgi:hypothetical protein
MYRLLLNSSLPNGNKFRTRVGVAQSYVEAAWSTDALVGAVYARWMTCGKPASTLPPVDLTGITTFLYDSAVAPTIATPDSIEVDVTRIDDLYVEPMTCIGVVSNATGNMVSIPITYTSEYTIMDVDALSGVHRFFFVPKTSVAITPSDLVSGKFTMYGTYLIHGVVKDDVCVFNDWVSVQYENNQTIIDFGTTYADSGDILYSRGYVASTYVTPTATYAKMPIEYPAAFVDPDNMLVDTTINLYNGFTSLQLGTLDPGIMRIIISEWGYAYLTRMYGGSMGFKGANVSPASSTSVLDTRYKGYFATLGALQSAYPTASAADWAMIGGLVNAVALWNSTSSSWVLVETDSEAVNPDIIYSRAGTVVENKIYYYKDSTWTLGDPTDDTTQMCALWIALGTNAATHGMSSNSIVSDDSWTWTTVDGPLYLDADGNMTETVPNITDNPDEVVRPVGYVLSATSVRFHGYLPGALLNSPSI